MTEATNRIKHDVKLSENHADNISQIGKPNTEKTVDMHGTVTENKPEIPMVKIRFLTIAAREMLLQKFGPKRPKGVHHIQSVKWFDDKVAKILIAARQDDPFADQVLLNIETAVASLGDFYKEEEAELLRMLQDKFQGNQSILQLTEQHYSEEIEIAFYNRLGYMLLWLTKSLDSVLYYLFNCDRYSILSSKEVKERRNVMKRKFRQILNLVNAWKATAITREDLAHNTAKVAQAFEKNSGVKLSKEVIYLELRADCAPEIHSHQDDQLDPFIGQKLRALYN
jgi:integrating conjugative element protein (TIGR03761 family)